MCSLIKDRRSITLKYYHRPIFVISLCWLLLDIFGTVACNGLELRQVQDNSLPQSGIAIPDETIKVFVYAGEPGRIKVNDDTIAVDYGRCGILFDRKTGERKTLYDIASGWPEIRLKEFPQANSLRINGRFIGPGIFDKRRSPLLPGEKEKLEPEAACSIEFKGTKWSACQPAGFLQTIQKEGYNNRTGSYSTWSGVLTRLNNESFLQADTEGQKSKRYTMSDGLASNIITRLVSSQGSLWASCVDIYEPEKNSWGPGGLSRFDPKTSRWEHIKTIDGHPVRWITLMQTVGDDLWIGFREGNGVEGDKIYFGMGIVADFYRPKAAAISLARFSNGKWKVFTKPLSLSDDIGDTKESPTQMPLKLAVSTGQVFLFCGYKSRRLSLNMEYELDGFISSLELKSGQWKTFDLYKDFDADCLVNMIEEKGEILLTSNRGVHRWDDKSKSWKYLDPQTTLKNSSIGTAAMRNNELWFGYTNRSFGILGRQGISVFNEETMKWSYFSPEQTGTGIPIRRMTVKSDGDVWIYCEWFPSTAVAAAEFPYYSRESGFFSKSGIGYFKNGKWKYPVEMSESKGLNFSQRNVRDLTAVGDKLFVATNEGVYLGPDKWQRIVEGDILRIDPSSDAKSLIILRQGPRKDPDSSTIQRGRYNISTSEVSFESLSFEEINRVQLEPQSYLWQRDSETYGMWRQSWVLLPEFKEQGWAVGPLGSNNGYHSVIETPYAFWIVSQGELVRLDRKNIESIVKMQ